MIPPIVEVAYWDGTLLHRTPFCPAEVKDLPVVVGSAGAWLFLPGERSVRVPTEWCGCEREDPDEWRLAALCFGVEEWWDLPYELQREDCKACPVATECLRTQLRTVVHNHEDDGVWGGTDRGARHRIRRMVRRLMAVGRSSVVGQLMLGVA